MASSNWKLYDGVMQLALQGSGMDFDSDTFTLSLFLSGSNAGDSTQSVIGNLTNPVLSVNGYAPVVVTPTVTRVSNVVTFDTSNAVFTASGGSIVGVYYSVLWNSTTNNILAFSILDDTPQALPDLTDTNSLTITITNVFSITS